LRRALAALERQRLIERRQGVGTYVAEATSERALFHFFRAESPDGARPTPTSRVDEVRNRPADAEEAKLLRLDSGTPVHALRRLRLVGARPVIAETIVLPALVFPGFGMPLGVELTDELYVHYQRRHGITVTRVEERLTATAAPPAIAAALSCGEAAPLLHIERQAFDLLDRVVELRRSWMETGRFALRNHADLIIRDAAPCR
jgi:GntR family transcriptional regulator